jgi:anti-sigma factor RsiW
MNCRQCSEDLTAFIDGELPGSDAEHLRLHLEMCPPCNAEYRDLSASADFVDTHARDLEPMPEIWNNLRARISEMPSPANSGGIFQFLTVNRWAAAMATLAATVVLAIGIWGYQQHQATEREFETFVNEYLVQRSVAERIHALQIRQTRNIIPTGELTPAAFLENPFAEGRAKSMTNPFQSEEK